VNAEIKPRNHPDSPEIDQQKQDRIRIPLLLAGHKERGNEGQEAPKNHLRHTSHQGPMDVGKPQPLGEGRSMDYSD